MTNREKLIVLIGKVQDEGRDYSDVVCSYRTSNERLADYLIANDVVPVVRCKDCKHTRKKTGHEQFMYNENVCICTKEDIWGITKNEPVWDDGFCSCGERRSDG